MASCNWCGSPNIDGKWCTEICQLHSEADNLRDENNSLMGDNAELSGEIDHLKEQIKMWQDEFCKIVKIRDRLVKRLSNKSL